MADETTTETATTTEQQAAPTSGGGDGVMFTPEQQKKVNSLVAQARREGKESGQKQQTSTAPVQGDKPTTQAADEPGEKITKTRRIEELEKQLKFERVARKHSIPDEVYEDQLALFKAHNPEDVDAWAVSQSKKYGFGKASMTQPTETEATATVPQKPPVIAPNGNAGAQNALTPGPNGLVNIFNLTVEQLDQMGPQGIRQQFEKILDYAHSRSGAPPVPQPTPRK